MFVHFYSAALFLDSAQNNFKNSHSRGGEKVGWGFRPCRCYFTFNSINGPVYAAKAERRFVNCRWNNTCNGIIALMVLFMQQNLTISSKQSKSAFILTIEVYFFVAMSFFGDNVFTDLLEVFLKVSTAWASFFMLLFLATFILALYFLTTNPWKVL